MRRITEAAKAVAKAQRLLLNFLQRGRCASEDTTDQMLHVLTQPELIKEMRECDHGKLRRKPNRFSRKRVNSPPGR
ncbi:hypothetical protein SAMN05216374_4749 [Tardiphaga sp. OK246]|nr:hypothetical protein SAMN05216374_4749 [Tardiphaga sp. OK246]